jgi:hypothetical protein
MIMQMVGAFADDVERPRGREARPRPDPFRTEVQNACRDRSPPATFMSAEEYSATILHEIGSAVASVLVG